MIYILLCQILQSMLRPQKKTLKALQSLLSCGSKSAVITMNHIATDLRIRAFGASLGTERAELYLLSKDFNKEIYLRFLTKNIMQE